MRLYTKKNSVPIQEDNKNDLGFGSKVTERTNTRFINRDGSFNVIREGLPFLQSLSLYHSLITMSWLQFYGSILLAYFVVNTIFAIGYFLCGPNALYGSDAVTVQQRFFDSFFFSVQTLATIGYGKISPQGIVANILVTIEALTGLLGVALATGLSFARFSRPSAKIAYSQNAIIAPYKDGTAFEFRILNQRKNQLFDVDVTVVLSKMETHQEKKVRKFYPLTLERSKVVFFPLHWTIVHPIDEQSPLKEMTSEDLKNGDVEVFILLRATDETFSQTVHSRSSYKHHEIIVGAKFGDMFISNNEQQVSIDARRLHNIDKV